jgi:hypothetical protein
MYLKWLQLPHLFLNEVQFLNTRCVPHLFQSNSLPLTFLISSTFLNCINDDRFPVVHIFELNFRNLYTVPLPGEDIQFVFCQQTLLRLQIIYSNYNAISHRFILSHAKFALFSLKLDSDDEF